MNSLIILTARKELLTNRTNKQNATTNNKGSVAASTVDEQPDNTIPIQEIGNVSVTEQNSKIPK